MAFPASQTKVKKALDDISSTALRIKNIVQAVRDESNAGDTPRIRFVACQRQIQQALNVWATAAAVPGLPQYAKDQYDDQTLDIVAEYNAMKAAAEAVRDWVFNNVPTDAGSGAALLEIYDQGGNPTDIMTTTGQAAGFRTAADTFLATIG
jgi:urocanate hydratase